jgi:PAS domain-containing protein
MRQLAPSGVSRPVAVADVPVPWRLVDDIQDAAALADEDGTIALATRRLAEMFGYEPAGLADRPVECLIPARLRAAHRRHRAAAPWVASAVDRGFPWLAGAG